MSAGFRQRVLEYFVEPAVVVGHRARGAGSPVPEAPAAAVLGRPDDVSGVAALLAAELRSRSRSACVLLAEWGVDGRRERRDGYTSRATRRLLSRLDDRDLDVRAGGRLVSLRCPTEPTAAAAAWRRARAVADCPSVWILAGPRPEGLEVLLRDLDLVVLVSGSVASAELGELASDGLAGGRAVVVTCRPVPGPVARMVASSSIATSRLLGADVIQAVQTFA